MDFNFVTPRLATGAALQSSQDVDVLVGADITHVIDCTLDSYETTAAFALHPALSCLWNPTQDDGQTKGVEWFHPSVEFGLMVMSYPDSKLYCHCSAGINRGPSTAFCIMLALGWTYNDALGAIHTARPATVNGVRYAQDAANALTTLGYLP
jgi:hypothetical protein